MEDILKDLIGDQEGVLSESAQKTLTEAIDAKVAEIVSEKVDLALDTQDKEHTGKLQELVELYEKKIKAEKSTLEEDIDTDHSEKAAEAFRKLDESYTAKLEQVVGHYQGLLSEGVKDEASVMVGALDTFLENWLDEHVPTDLIHEAAKKDYSKDLLTKISNLVGINESVDDDIRQGLKDAKQVIDHLRTENDRLQKSAYLQESTKNLPVAERQFITESLSDDQYDLDYVKRNIGFTQKLFAKQSEAPVRVAQETTTAKNVDRQVIVEHNEDPDGKGAEPQTAMAVWAQKAASSDIYGKR